MSGPSYAICAITSFVGLIFTLYINRGRWTPGRAGTAAAFAFVGIGMTLSVPAIGAAVDRATGLNELWRLIAHLCVMGLVACAETQLVMLAFPPEQARRRISMRIWMSIAAAATLTALYALANLHPGPVTFNVEDARIPAVSAYLLVYLAAFVWYTVDIVRLAWRFARATPRPWSRRGLRLAAIGAGFGFLYCVDKAAFIVGYWIGFRPAGEKTISAVLILFSCVFCAAGFTLPAWGPAIDVARRWAGRRRSYRQLYPLWRDLIQASPDLVLDSRLDHGRAPLRGVDFALTRRVVEICDARLALRPWISAHAITVTGEPARDEAVRIAAGVDARRRDRMADDPDTAPITDPPGGYDGQVAWLVAVAGVYRRLSRDRALVGTRVTTPVTREAP
ncbi:MAB_1171c family putative transporter [Virgisporangium aurantiacum]|uniref:DUF6545 domain-containing protein n=1 Tax=Virgisporangium aurantiacum TaxID=175570 RepID=A0A8J4E5S9_9ACTN|nr:MAB_1171c family putative transporter [Virgisporangium aurantiacum]GIJ62413.1 hypothetical protein Vau01_099290 [Virgisporangium aurantiacum]